MNLSDAKDLVGVAGGLIGIIAMVYAWLIARSKVNAEHVSDLLTRVQSIEADFRHIPSKDTVHGLELSISEIKGDIHAMSEAFSAVQRTAQRIENYLLGGKA